MRAKTIEGLVAVLFALSTACSPPCPAGLVPTEDGACIHPLTDGGSDGSADASNDASVDATSVACDGSSGELCDGLDNDCSNGPDDGFACVRGATIACQTRCGSTGSGACSDSCEAPAPEACTPPAEVCNEVDDDCDGRVDEGVQTLSPRFDFGGGLSMRAAALSDGFVAVYNVNTELRAQRVNLDGTEVGDATTVVQSNSPSWTVSVLDGRVYVFWIQRDSGASTYSLWGTAFNESLVRTGEPEVLENDVSGSWVGSYVSGTGDSLFVSFVRDGDVLRAEVDSALEMARPLSWAELTPRLLVSGPASGETTLIGTRGSSSIAIGLLNPVETTLTGSVTAAAATRQYLALSGGSADAVTLRFWYPPPTRGVGVFRAGPQVASPGTEQHLQALASDGERLLFSRVAGFEWYLHEVDPRTDPPTLSSTLLNEDAYEDFPPQPVLVFGAKHRALITRSALSGAYILGCF